MNSEYYIIAVTKLPKTKDKKSIVNVLFGSGEKFYVIIKSRKELSEIYSLMPVDTYKVETITTLNDTKSFEDFKKELTKNERNKPKGLEF